MPFFACLFVDNFYFILKTYNIVSLSVIREPPPSKPQGARLQSQSIGIGSDRIERCIGFISFLTILKHAAV